MQDLLNAAFAPVNIGYTILMMIVLLYWLSVILGAIDLDAFDLDLDADVDVDADVDLDADVDAEAGSIGGAIAGVLAFLNFGRVPFMLIMSVVILTAWSLAILTNHYYGNYTWGVALVAFLPIMLVSFIVAKIVSTPFVPLFARFNQVVKEIDYIGHPCRLRLPASADKFGQAEVNIDGDNLLINVKTAEGEDGLASGEEALVIGQTADKRYYLVRRLDETF